MKRIIKIKTSCTENLTEQKITEKLRKLLKEHGFLEPDIKVETICDKDPEIRNAILYWYDEKGIEIASTACMADLKNKCFYTEHDGHLKLPKETRDALYKARERGKLSRRIWIGGIKQRSSKGISIPIPFCESFTYDASEKAVLYTENGKEVPCVVNMETGIITESSMALPEEIGHETVRLMGTGETFSVEKEDDSPLSRKIR